jgi:hypothetical protein
MCQQCQTLAALLMMDLHRFVFNFTSIHFNYLQATAHETMGDRRQTASTNNQRNVGSKIDNITRAPERPRAGYES